MPCAALQFHTSVPADNIHGREAVNLPYTLLLIPGRGWDRDGRKGLSQPHEASLLEQANSQGPGETDEQGIGLGSEAWPLPLVPSVALPTKLGRRGILWMSRAS